MGFQEVVVSACCFLLVYFFKDLTSSVKTLNSNVARILERMEIHSQEIERLRNDVDKIKESK